MILPAHAPASDTGPMPGLLSSFDKSATVLPFPGNSSSMDTRDADERNGSTWNDSNEVDPEPELPSNAEIEAEPGNAEAGTAEPAAAPIRAGSAEDPLRVYLQQMGPLPLLSRSQEIDICRRIEAAQNEVKRIVMEFGFACKEHIALARKLLSVPPKERFDRLIVDSKLANKERHLTLLEKLARRAEAWDQQLDENYQDWRRMEEGEARLALDRQIQKLKARIRLVLPRFGLQRKVVEELAIIAKNLYSQFQTISVQIRELGQSPGSAERDAQLLALREKMVALEQFVRMPWNDYRQRCELLNSFSERATQASSEMVERNLRLVVSIAKKYNHRG